MEVYERIRLYVESNCKAQALARLDQAIEEQKMLMAEYLQHTNDGEFVSYVSYRSPDLITKLRSQPISWDKTWVYPECNDKRDKRKGLE